MNGLPRRELLAAGGAAAFLAACNSDDDSGPAAAEPADDAGLLNRALGLENALVASYAAGNDLLSGELRRRCATVLEHERAHAERLTEAILAIDGIPTRPRPDEQYRERLPNLRTEEDVLRFAVDLENLAARTYLDVIPGLVAPHHRELAGSINAAEAQHASLWLGALGRPRAPHPFVTGVEPVS